jgi:hypothetical protein
MVGRTMGTGMVFRRTSFGIIVSYGRRPSLTDCMRHSGATAGTYAAEIVRRAYEWYVEDAVDLKREYERYYRPEYRNVAAFLYVKYGFSRADIEALMSDLDSDRHVALAIHSARPFGGVSGFISYAGNDEPAARLLGARWEDVV